MAQHKRSSVILIVLTWILCLLIVGSIFSILIPLDLSGLLKLCLVSSAILCLFFGFINPKYITNLLVVSPAINFEFVTETYVYTFTDIVLLLFVVFILFSGEISRLQKSRLIAITLVISTLVAFMSGTKTQQSVIGLFKWIALIIVFLYFAQNHVSGSYAQRMEIAKVLAMANLLSGAAGTLQRNGLYDFFSVPFNANRADSTFQYYTNYSHFLVLSLPFVFYLVLSRDRTMSRFWRSVGFLSLIFSIPEIVLNISRGAILSLGLVMTIMLALHRKQVILFATTLTVSTFVIVLNWSSIRQSDVIVEYLSRFNNTPDGERRLLQSTGLDVVIAHPLGIGVGNFRQYLEAGPWGFAKALYHPHNLYLAIALEIGLIGLLVICIVYLRILLKILSISGDQNNSLARTYFIGLSVVFFQGVEDYFFYESANALTFVILLGTLKAFNDKSVGIKEGKVQSSV